MATQKTGRKTIAGVMPNLTDNRELKAAILAVFGKTKEQIIRDQKTDPSTFLQLAYVLWSVRGLEQTKELLKTDLNTIAHARAYAASTNYNILKFRLQARELLKAA